MNKSESIKELATALAKAQAEMPAVKMNAVNPFLKNKYADLGAVIDTAKPVLAKHGLSVSQMVGGDGNSVSVTTIVMHSSGEWIESTVNMAAGEERGKSAAQVAGSIITYLRRYSLASALGMYADEDGDGNSHTQQKPAAQNTQPAQQPAQPANQPQPAPVKSALQFPATLAEAEAVTDGGGNPYKSLTTEKLQSIRDSQEAPEAKRRAAKMILEARAAK